MGLLILYIILILFVYYFFRNMPTKIGKRIFLFVLGYYMIFWYVNHFIFVLKGASVDALKFHESGIVISSNGAWDYGLGAQLFSGWIGALYKIFGISHASISLVSILMVVGSLCFMSKIIKELNMNPNAVWGVVLFFLLPSMVFRSVTTLREAYIIFLFAGACLAYAKFLKHDKSVYLILFLISFVLMMALHKAMIIFGSIVLPFMAICIRYKRGKGLMISPVGILGLSILVVLFVSYLNLIGMPSEQLPKGLRELNAIVTIDSNYITRVLTAKSKKEAGASYHLYSEVRNLADITGVIVKSYVYYLFKPFPQDIDSWVDLYAMAENCLFFVFGMGLVYFVVKADNKITASIVYLYLMLFIVNSFIWGIGTTNWGTASRHHLIHNWIVYLIGAAGWLNWAGHVSWRRSEQK